MLQNAKSGACQEDCHYCSQSAISTALQQAEIADFSRLKILEHHNPFPAVFVTELSIILKTIGYKGSVSDALLKNDLGVNGKLTETENIADLGGLAAAFDAYRRTLGSRITDKNYVRQHDREFFIGFAQSWRARIGEVAMRKQLASDHAPENYRVATVRNFDAWYDAFDVVRGQRLYLAPKARVRIW